jgi:TonB-dependent receptor
MDCNTTHPFASTLFMEDSSHRIFTGSRQLLQRALIVFGLIMLSQLVGPTPAAWAQDEDFEYRRKLSKASSTDGTRWTATRPAQVDWFGIHGQVVDQASGTPVLGAAIQVSPSPLRTSTDLAGRYAILHLDPEVDYTLQVKASGFQTMTMKVKGKEGVLNAINVSLPAIQSPIWGLEQNYLNADNVQSRPITLNQTVVTPTNGRFPDFNIGDAMTRLPNVTASRQNGESRFLTVRGLPANHLVTTWNYVQLPGTETDGRGFAFDLLSSEQIGAVKLHKTFLPFMDGDAVSGLANVSSMPVASDTFKFMALLGAGYNYLSERPNFQFSFGIQGRLGKSKRWGYQIATSNQFRNVATDYLQVNWNPGTATQTPINSLHLQDQQIYRQRSSLTATLDYRFHPASRLFLRTLIGAAGDEGTVRQRSVFDGSNSPIADRQPGVLDIDLSTTAYQNYQTLFALQAGGEHLIGTTKIDYIVSVAESVNETPFSRTMLFRNQTPIKGQWDIADTRYPQAVYDPNQRVFDYSDYQFNSYQIQKQTTIDPVIEGRVNVQTPFEAGALAGKIQWGASYRGRTRTRAFDFEQYRPAVGSRLTLNTLLGDERERLVMNEKYAFGQTADAENMHTYFDRNPGVFDLERIPSQQIARTNDYELTEETSAAYAMLDLNWKKWQALIGVRFEHLSNRYKGYFLLANPTDWSANATERTFDRSFWLPSVHLRRQLGSQTQLRASYSSTYQRPDFIFWVPFRSGATGNAFFQLGNPELMMPIAHHFDLSLSHDYVRGGNGSFGVFYKSIEDFAYTLYNVGQTPAFNPFFQQYAAPFTAYNGSWAHVYGVELGWQQQLYFLPGFLKGFGIVANYSYTESEAEYGTRDFEFRPNKLMRLQGQSNHVANVGLYFQNDRLAFRIMGHYTDKSLAYLGSFENDDVYLAERIQVDVHASYRFTKRWSIFAEVLNFNNAPTVFYTTDRNRPVMRSQFGWWANGGLRFDW